MLQGLGLRASTVEGRGLIPGGGAKSHMLWGAKQNKQKTSKKRIQNKITIKHMVLLCFFFKPLFLFNHWKGISREMSPKKLMDIFNVLHTRFNMLV